MNNKSVFSIIILFLAIFLGIPILIGSWYVVSPGQRGVKTTMGKMDTQFVSPGLHFKLPIVTSVEEVSIKQDTKEISSDCFSSDLQEIKLKIKVLYSIPESSVVSVLRDYSGDPFEKLILPRIQEATKEVTAIKTAADIAKLREQIKTAALTESRRKIGTFLTVDDLVIEDVMLSPELKAAIESKMVQQQDAEKAVFRKQQATIDAETAYIKAQGEAKSITIQGEALEKNPKLVELKMVEKWDGKTPQVVGAGSNILLPIGK